MEVTFPFSAKKYLLQVSLMRNQAASSTRAGPPLECTTTVDRSNPIHTALNQPSEKGSGFYAAQCTCQHRAARPGSILSTHQNLAFPSIIHPAEPKITAQLTHPKTKQKKHISRDSVGSTSCPEAKLQHFLPPRTAAAPRFVHPAPPPRRVAFSVLYR